MDQLKETVNELMSDVYAAYDLFQDLYIGIPEERDETSRKEKYTHFLESEYVRYAPDLSEKCMKIAVMDEKIKSLEAELKRHAFHMCYVYAMNQLKEMAGSDETSRKEKYIHFLESEYVRYAPDLGKKYATIAAQDEKIKSLEAEIETRVETYRDVVLKSAEFESEVDTLRDTMCVRNEELDTAKKAVKTLTEMMDSWVKNPSIWEPNEGPFAAESVSSLEYTDDELKRTKQELEKTAAIAKCLLTMLTAANAIADETCGFFHAQLEFSRYLCKELSRGSDQASILVAAMRQAIATTQMYLNDATRNNDAPSLGGAITYANSLLVEALHEFFGEQLD